MFGSLLKAAVGVVLTPIAVVVDIVTLPATADTPHRGAFDNTGHMLNSVGKNIDKALK